MKFYLVVEVVGGSPVDGNTKGPGALALSVLFDATRLRELHLAAIPIAEIPTTAAFESLLEQIGRFRILLNVLKEAADVIQGIPEDEIPVLVEHHTSSHGQGQSDDHKSHVLMMGA